MNALQVLNANQCLYFRDEEDRSWFRETLTKFRNRRPALEDLVETRKVFEGGQEGIHFKTIALDVPLPGVWSFCKNREHFVAGDFRYRDPEMVRLYNGEVPSINQSPLTPFNVLIMYEDFGTGKRAKGALDYVAEELGNDFEFRNTMWRLDVLKDPKVNILAAHAFAEADLLMISLRGERRIPAEIRVLIDTWLVEKTYRERALVALFEPKASETRGSVYGYLTNLARQYRLDFLVQEVREPGDQEEASLKLIWVF
jgi:hypothetical protein